MIKKHSGFLILLLIVFNAYAAQYNNSENTQIYNDNSSTNQISATLSPSILLSDTPGPSFVLSQGTAPNRVISSIDNSIGYYSTTNCSAGSLINTGSLISSGTFTFINNAPIYFGQTALSALSSNNTNTRCINLALLGSSAYVVLQIRNLTCNGSTCTGGTVCVDSNTAPINEWTTTTPDCP